MKINNEVTLIGHEDCNRHRSSRSVYRDSEITWMQNKEAATSLLILRARNLRSHCRIRDPQTLGLKFNVWSVHGWSVVTLCLQRCLFCKQRSFFFQYTKLPFHRRERFSWTFTIKTCKQKSEHANHPLQIALMCCHLYWHCRNEKSEMYLVKDVSIHSVC